MARLYQLSNTVLEQWLPWEKIWIAGIQQESRVGPLTYSNDINRADIARQYGIK